MKVNNRTVLNTVAALRRLDGDKDRTFKFSALTSYQLAKMLRRLQDSADLVDKLRTDLAKKHGIGLKRAQDEDPMALAAFSEDFNQILDQETEITPISLKLGELNLETNLIPVSVIAALDWLIVEETAGAK